MALSQPKPPAAFRKHVLALIGENYGDKTLVLCPTAFVKLLSGDHKAAILLAQILYWGDRTRDPNGWFYKSYAEWKLETGLSESQVRRIVNGDPRVQSSQITLRDLGVETVLKKVKRTGAPTLHYRINQTQFLTALERSLGQGNSQQCEGSIPDKAQDEHLAESGMNTAQSAASLISTKTSNSKTSAVDHDQHSPAHHPDEDSDLEVFYPFESRFGLLKPSAKTVLRHQLERLGATKVREVLDRCATRGRWWGYAEKALANEATVPPEGGIQPQEGRSLTLPGDKGILTGDDLICAPEAAVAFLAVSPRVQTRWTDKYTSDSTVQNAWDGAYQQLELQLDRASFETCLRGATLVDYEPETMTFMVVVRTAYARDFLQGRLDRMVKRIVGDVFEPSAAVRFLLKEDWQALTKAGEAA
ncbi:MAG: hypothetical protein ABI700_09950 [Chloroflexota bacterium]